MKTLCQFIEPLMIVVMGGIIGFVAISLLLPMFGAATTLARVAPRSPASPLAVPAIYSAQSSDHHLSTARAAPRLTRPPSPASK